MNKLLLPVVFFAFLAGCTSEFVYDELAGARENDCMQFENHVQHQECVLNARQPRDMYKKKVETELESEPGN